jgi:hypothetical protein
MMEACASAHNISASVGDSSQNSEQKAHNLNILLLCIKYNYIKKRNYKGISNMRV